MSGKGEGKKRNRAAQSEQHGFQESSVDKAARPAAGETAGTGAGAAERPEKQRVLEKMHDLEERRRQKEHDE